jgi:hypothetical protein
MNHTDGTRAQTTTDVPISKGLSPMAKVLMGLALALVFMQGTFTVLASGYARVPPADAAKVELPPIAP